MLLIDLSTAYFTKQHQEPPAPPPPVQVVQPALAARPPRLAVVILPTPTPTPATVMPTYGDVIQTAYGPMHLVKGTLTLAAATPQHEVPDASSPAFSTFSAGMTIHTAGYVDRPNGRWYEVIYDGTGWVKP